MKNYEFDNEMIIYRGYVTDCNGADFEDKSEQQKAELILANEHIAIIKSSDQNMRYANNVEIISLKDIKVFDNTIQIIRNENTVKIYTLQAEKFLLFPNENEAMEFTDKTLKLIHKMLKFVKGI